MIELPTVNPFREHSAAAVMTTTPDPVRWANGEGVMTIFRYIRRFVL